MPLFNTSPSNSVVDINVKQLLEEKGISPKDKDNLTDLLKKNNLDTNALCRRLSEVIEGAESDHISLRGIEMGFKLNGVMREDATKNIPAVNIIINDSQSVSVNPILIPREINLSND